MTYRIVIQPRAEREIREAARYRLEASRSRARALQWARGVRANPGRCPVDPDPVAYGREVRVLLYGTRRGIYRILFTIEDDVVHVLTVRHAARRSLREEMEGEEG